MKRFPLPTHYFCAVLIALNGTVNILSAWLIHHPARIALLKKILPMVVIRGSWLTAVMAGSVQLFLSYSLGRRKLLAWRIASIVLLLAIATNLLRGAFHPWPGWVPGRKPGSRKKF
ncbi:MAG: hypothetical protein AB1556_04875 [Bacillota bacterium]